ncbi:hypothetical protein SAMN06295912_15028 [Sphingomonas laterariae]|uniref:Uncharacterized protein n=1 Tax=Edaphosphingomonas laterariae TaxID=861865 RepID=A0A239KDD4_9SPHN|nr:hypothetical protein [Sphingomonas laterariae]SNT16141.1 hypothetical protein SAMN06295912_15028 [Sphingomonas laterariae]
MTEMVDMSRFVEAKSDQLNADDLIGAPRTITITRVTGNDGDQPVSIFYQGDNGKPFKPCKTIRRVLMGVWGRYANEYVGKSMTLYRDDKVTFGGLETGGIRISHMSDIDREMIVVVMKSKGKKAGVKILPLVVEQKADKVADGVRALIERIQNGEDIDADPAVAKQRAWLADNRPELAAKVDLAIAERRPAQGDDDPFGLPVLDHGEAQTTVDPEADILAHIARKTTAMDVNSLVSSRIGELDDEAAERVRAAAVDRIAAIKEAAK